MSFLKNLFTPGFDKEDVQFHHIAKLILKGRSGDKQNGSFLRRLWKRFGKAVSYLFSVKKIMAGTIVLLIVSFLVALLGIYRFSWDNGIALFIAKKLRLPAISVNGQWLPILELYEDMETLEHFYLAEGKGEQFLLSEKAEMRKNLTDRMIRKFFLYHIANSRQISVDENELQEEWGAILSKASSQEEVERTLESLYGWDSETFQRKVLHDVILERKLEKFLQSRQGEGESEENISLVEKEIERLKKEAKIWYFVDFL